MKKVVFTPKAKTMIPLLSFFILFFIALGFLRYQEVKETIEHEQDEFAYRISNAYQQSLETTFKFFTHRGLSCMTSKTIKEALRDKNSASIRNQLFTFMRELRDENPYLQDLRFYDASFQPLLSFNNATFSSKVIPEIIRGESYATFSVEPQSFTYNVFVPALCNNEFIGMVEFIIDAEYFLEYMNNSLGIQSTLFINTDFFGIQTENLATIDNFQLLSSSLPTELQSSDVFHNLSASSQVTLRLKERTFMAHVFNVLDAEAQNLARFVFLQEITDYDKKLMYWMKKTFAVSLVFILLCVFVVNFWFNILTKKLNEANKKLQHSENNLLLINKNLETRVNTEIHNRLLKEEEALEKERIMIHQDKLASMGEMIGNIAHQWRQPLTELGSLFIRLEICFEQGILNAQELQNISQKSQHLISHMSQTIDDFRNFFSTHGSVSTFSINDAYHKSFHLIGAALRNHYIEVSVHEEETLFIEGTQNELIQAILNILSNAKDVLIERHIKHPKIIVSIFKRDKEKVLQIKDNAGGIMFEPVSKIFEPYVSSKHASSGTGIGLYMTKNIIEKNQKGMLKAYNQDAGAVFEIIFL